MTWKSPKGELLYRIGDVIISTNAQNPSSFFGGTWQLLCPGRTLVCVDTSQNEFNTVKKTGGSKYLQNHAHIASCSTSGNHNHTVNILSGGSHTHPLIRSGRYGEGNTGYDFASKSNGNWRGSSTFATESAGAHTHSINIASSGAHTHSITVNATGNGNAQNIQPYMAVYMWVRIA